MHAAGYSVKMDGTSMNVNNHPVMSLSLNSPSAGHGSGSTELGGVSSPMSISGRAASTTTPVAASHAPQSLTITPLLTTISQQQSEQRQHQQHQSQHQQQEAEDQDGSGEGSGGASAAPSGADATALLNQMNQLGPSDRCTPTQAQAMGQQLLSIIAYHERNKITLPGLPSPPPFIFLSLFLSLSLSLSHCVCVCVCESNIIWDDKEKFDVALIYSRRFSVCEHSVCISVCVLHRSVQCPGVCVHVRI